MHKFVINYKIEESAMLKHKCQKRSENVGDYKKQRNFSPGSEGSEHVYFHNRQPLDFCIELTRKIDPSKQTAVKWSVKLSIECHCQGLAHQRNNVIKKPTHSLITLWKNFVVLIPNRENANQVARKSLR